MREDDARLADLLETLERLAGGELDLKVPISPEHDALDAIAFGVNVLVGELRYAGESLRRAKEDADRANQAKSTLLRNVSHELRTPLAAIVSLAERLSSEASPERVADVILAAARQRPRAALAGGRPPRFLDGRGGEAAAGGRAVRSAGGGAGAGAWAGAAGGGEGGAALGERRRRRRRASRATPSACAKSS